MAVTAGGRQAEAKAGSPLPGGARRVSGCARLPAVTRRPRTRSTGYRDEAAPSPATRGIRLAALLVGLVLPACSGPEEPRPSIVLWIVDTLRVDRLGLYGFERPVSPNYDAMAEQATVFESAMAQSSWTRPTVATMLTGVNPLRHGVNRGNDSLGDEWQMLPELLQELGYATAFFTANGQVQSKFGFDQGFDEFWFKNRAPADALVDHALGWMDGLREESPDKPFFIMILSIEPHDGYEPVEPFRGRFAGDVGGGDIGTVKFMQQLRFKKRPSSPDLVRQLLQLYEGEVAWSDYEFGRFRRNLDERDVDPAIVVIADHGEEFGEHGHFGHLNLHREAMHIPFLVRLPGQTAGRRVERPVQQADLLPTLVDLAGGNANDVDGQSLVPLLNGEDMRSSRPIVSASFKSGAELQLPPFYSLVLDRWKLIWAKRPGTQSTILLFDRVSDPEELVDLAGEQPELARRLLRVLQEEIEILENKGGADSVEVTIDEETRRQLEALGYVD